MNFFYEFYINFNIDKIVFRYVVDTKKSADILQQNTA